MFDRVLAEESIVAGGSASDACDSTSGYKDLTSLCTCSTFGPSDNTQHLAIMSLKVSANIPTPAGNVRFVVEISLKATHFYNDAATRVVTQQALEDAMPQVISKIKKAVAQPEPTYILEGEGGGLHLVIHNMVNEERLKIALRWGCTIWDAADALWSHFAEYRPTDSISATWKGKESDVSASMDDLYKKHDLEHGDVVELYNEELRSLLLSDLRAVG